MEKARVKENKTRGSSLFLSLDASVFRVVRFFVLARSRFSAVSKRVLYSSVLHFFPQSCFLNCFFFSHKFRVFESFPGLLDPVSETTSFGLLLPNTPLQREREREREAAMKIHLKTLYVVLSTFSGALFSFVAFDHPLGLVFSNGFLLSPLFFDSFFPIEISGIQNDSDSKRTCVSSSSSRRIQNDRTAQKFDIDVSDPSTTTILRCKELAVAEHPSLGPETDFLVFVHKGKVLEDAKTVEEAEITEDGFVVVMSKKTKKPAEKTSVRHRNRRRRHKRRKRKRLATRRRRCKRKRKHKRRQRQQRRQFRCHLRD